MAQTLPPALHMAYQGRYGVYTDSSSGMLWNGSRYYAPTIGRHTQPSGPGYVAGNPYAYTPPPQEDAPDADILPDNWNGRQFYYDGFRRTVNQGAGIAESGLLTAASFNPLCILSEAISGQNAAGDKVSKLQRGFDILMLAAGPLVKGALAGGRGVLARLGGRLGNSRHRAVVEAVKRWAEAQGRYWQYPNERLLGMSWRKRGRFPDVTLIDRTTGRLELFQIGKLDRRGMPVRREMDAIRDILRYLRETKAGDVTFVPSNIPDSELGPFARFLPF